MAASWQRSYQAHRLDPAEAVAGERLEESNLGHRRGALDQFLHIASPRLDSLFGLVGHSGCGVLLTDADGIILEHRVAQGDAEAFRSWGLWSGTNWSEAAEGTNGIGTCLTEKRQVTIHRDDHFLARNIGMSCMDAPIFAPDGTLLAALDVSSARSDQTETFNALIAAMVTQTAQLIETETFRAAFPGCRIIAADGSAAGGTALLAVDGDDIVVGASRAARKTFGLTTSGDLTPQPAADILGREDGARGFERAERAAVTRALARSAGNVSAAARALGVGRATLYRRMKRLGIA